MKRVFTALMVIAVFAALMVLSGCKKKPAPVRPTLPPPTTTPAPTPARSPAPTIELQANPSTVERGGQTTLSWKTQNATSVLIDSGVGNVSENGSVVVTPRESSTFTATAKGPGGEAQASTRVTVVSPKEVVGITSSDIDNLSRAIEDGRVKDVFFAYDKSDLTPESRAQLEQDARWLRQYPGATVVIEGHCDERGTEEYNLALGDRRAQATKEYLVQLGVTAEQMETISLGEERPFVEGHDEAAWAQNRRAHFTVKR
jgi:peptidoglycan-associated lipoprotein